MITCRKTNYNYIFIATSGRFCDNVFGRQTTTTFSLQLVVVSVITGWKVNYNYIFIATCCRFGDNMLKDKLQVHFRCNLCRFCDNMSEDKLQLHFHCNLLSFLGKHFGRHATTTFSLQLVILPEITCSKTNYNYIFIATCVVSAITCWKTNYNYIFIATCCRFCDNMLEDKLQLHFHCNLLSFLW